MTDKLWRGSLIDVLVEVYLSFVTSGCGIAVAATCKWKGLGNPPAR